MNLHLLCYRIFSLWLIIALCESQERTICQYMISHDSTSWNSTCFGTIDQALQKIKTLNCDEFDIILQTSSSPYPLEFSGQAFSGSLNFLRIMSKELSFSPKIIVNDANIKMNTQSLFINNIEFVLNRTLKYHSVFELKSDSVSDPICSLNQVILTGANKFTMGSFIESSGYKMVLSEVTIQDNKLYVSELLRSSFFEFFYISNNSTFREESNNLFESIETSFVKNTYHLVKTQEEGNFLKAAAIEMGSSDINASILTLKKQTEDRALLFRIKNVIQCDIQSAVISNNVIYGPLIKISPLIGSAKFKINFSNITAEENIVSSGTMISLFGNLDDVIIKGIKFNSNSLSDQSNFISMPLTFNDLVFDDAEISKNMLSESAIIAPLNGAITPIFQLNLYGISIKNFSFIQNIFKDSSIIFYVKNYDYGIELYDWKFLDNTFLNESNPVTLVQVPKLNVTKANFMGNYLEDVVFRVSIALQVFFIDNLFEGFVPPSPSRLVGSYSTGGILEGEICQGGLFTNNTIRNYFSLNYKAFSIVDYRCNLAFNETKTNYLTQEKNMEKFIFKNNTFEMCYIIGYNDFNSLISVQLHEKEHSIEFYDNIFHGNTLESSVNFVRSATNIIIYSTLSTVIISNCNFTNNQANSQIPNIGIFSEALTVLNSNFENNGLQEIEGMFSNYTNLATTGGALAAAVNDLNVSCCVFRSNRAERGAALYLERSNLKLISSTVSSSRNLSITNSTFFNNSGGYGGAIYFDSSQINQTLDVTWSKFVLNTAVFAGGAFFFDGEVSSQLSSKIDSSEFDENSAMQGGAIFYLATSNLRILNCIFHYSKVNLLTFKHSNSTVTIICSRFFANSQQQGESGNELINVDGYFSTNLVVRMLNCSFMDIPNTDNKYATILQVRGNDARVHIYYSNYSNIKFGKYGIILIREAGKLIINGSSFYNLTGKYIPEDDSTSKTDTRLSVDEDSAAIVVKTQGRLSIDHSNFTEVSGSLILVLNTGTQIMLYNSLFSRIQGIDGAAVDFHGDTWVPELSKTQIVQGCKFINCSAETMGGAIIGQAMIYNISESTFTNCSARAGGAIRILATSQVSMASCLFRRNRADYGAAISFDSSTTSNFKNLRFDRNVARIYGNNFASFASSIVLKIDDKFYNEYNFTNQTVKQSLKLYGTNYTKLEFHLIDKENQTVKDENQALVSLHIETQDNQTHQLLLERAAAGVVTIEFQSIVLYGLPGSTSVLYATQKTTNKTVKIYITFRECELGEILDEKTKSCFRCGPGTYTIRSNDKECHACPKDAICYGGYNFHLKPGFWRASINSTNIISCGERKKYCEGGLESKCLNNTGGVLCESCNSSATPPNVKDTLNQCVVCDKARMNYGIKIALVLIGIISLSAVLFFFVLKSNYSYTREGTNLSNLSTNKRSKNFGVFLRITLMYCQLLMLLKNFDGEISRILIPLYNIFGDPIVNILFWSRCWITLLSSKLNQVFFEYIITISLPLFIFLLLVIYVGIFKKSYFRRSKRPEYISVLVLIFTWLQPQLLMRNFSMIFCTEISDGEWYLKQYVDFKCEGPGFQLQQTLTIFGIISWGLLLPLYLLLELYNERNTLKDSKTHVKLGFLYHGYHSKYYYWYFVTHTLKSTMILITSLWVHSSPSQGITLMLICLIYLILLTRFKPYHDQYANETEIDVLLVYISLVFFITKYTDADSDSWTKGLWYVLIILVIVYSLIKILGGIFLSVKETTDPLLNWISRICFWSHRNKKMRRTEKKGKKSKKNEIQKDNVDRTRTQTTLKTKVSVPMTRSRIKTEFSNYEIGYANSEASLSQNEALKQRLLPTVL